MQKSIRTFGFLSEEDIYPTHILSVVWPHNTSAVQKGVKNHKINYNMLITFVSWMVSGFI